MLCWFFFYSETGSYSSYYGQGYHRVRPCSLRCKIWESGGKLLQAESLNLRHLVDLRGITLTILKKKHFQAENEGSPLKKRMFSS